jgi:hypothetical protein
VSYLERRIGKLEEFAAANAPAQSVFSTMTPDDQELVRRYRGLSAAGQHEAIDAGTAEFRAYRRYMFAVAAREAELGIVPSADEIVRVRRDEA